MAESPVVVMPVPIPADEVARAQALASRYRCEFVDLKNFRIQHELFRSVPVDLMFRYNFVPLEQLDDRLVIAVSDPSRLMMLDEIAGLLGQRVVTRVATLSQITDLLKKTEQSQRVLDEASEGLTFDVISSEENQDENISIEKLTSEEDISPIIRLVDTTIFTALERRASDIHIETYDDSLMVKYRIDGVLQAAMAPIAREHHTTILSRIKVMSELDIAERRVPQDGRFRVRYKGRLIDFRVSIMPTVHGENAVLRVLDKESMSEKFKKLTLDVVGFQADDLARFRRYIREPYGMVLVTGPTGSGKTTTLYAALNEIKSDEDKIITIEDPVEYQIRGITQIPVNEKKGLTFARGLRSILRHDPDKILVGEIRDQETAQIAINAALTGHQTVVIERQPQHLLEHQAPTGRCQRPPRTELRPRDAQVHGDDGTFRAHAEELLLVVGERRDGAFDHRPHAVVAVAQRRIGPVVGDEVGAVELGDHRQVTAVPHLVEEAVDDLFVATENLNFISLQAPEEVLCLFLAKNGKQASHMSRRRTRDRPRDADLSFPFLVRQIEN